MKRTHPTLRAIRQNRLAEEREQQRLRVIKFWEDDRKFWEEEHRLYTNLMTSIGESEIKKEKHPINTWISLLACLVLLLIILGIPYFIDILFNLP